MGPIKWVPVQEREGKGLGWDGALTPPQWKTRWRVFSLWLWRMKEEMPPCQTRWCGARLGWTPPWWMQVQCQGAFRHHRGKGRPFIGRLTLTQWRACWVALPWRVWRRMGVEVEVEVSTPECSSGSPWRALSPFAFGRRFLCSHPRGTPFSHRVHLEWLSEIDLFWKKETKSMRSQAGRDRLTVWFDDSGEGMEFFSWYLCPRWFLPLPPLLLHPSCLQMWFSCGWVQSLTLQVTMVVGGVRGELRPLYPRAFFFSGEVPK